MRAPAISASALLACSLLFSLSANAAPGNGHDCRPDQRADRGKNHCGGDDGGRDAPRLSADADAAVTREALAAEVSAQAAAGGRALRLEAGAEQALPPIPPEPPASPF